MRIFLALPEFMQDATRPRPAALRALRRVIHVAERDGIYLDITGDIVWKLPQDAGWYDLLPEAERWQVQARFWQAVARVAARSPAVLTYELTNEPAICVNEPSWYAAPVQGLLYVQCVVRTLNDRDAYGLAQAWTRDLRAAIRAEDRTHLVSIGLLPVPNGSFGPQNMAGLLGLLTVHDFPEDGRLDGYVNTIRQFAKPGRPVLLGETFLLKSSAQTWRRYLLRTRRWVVGTLTFFDGRTPAEDKGRTLADVMYRDSLTEYLGLRAALLR
jgi:hypothetical protein